MKVLLLIAGRSVRFWPLSDKPFFRVCGKTLLEHQVERLQKAGLKDITLVGGAHNLEKAATLFPKLPCIQQEDLGMGMQGAMLSSLPYMGDAPVMVVSSNDLIEPSAYKDLAAAAKKKGVDGAILARKVSAYFPGGYLTIENGRITSIIEKPGEGREPSDLVNIVGHVHNDPKAFVKTLQEMRAERDDGYERALSIMFRNHRYVPVPYAGAWHAVKYPWHLLPVLDHLLQGTKRSIHKTAKIHKTAVIDGDVRIDANVRVLPHATIVGPCVIEEGAVIGNCTLVRQSCVGKKSVIGFGSEVKGSVVGDNVWTHMCYLGDSIVGNNVGFGGGSLTGNFRLDEGEIGSTYEDKVIGTGLRKLGAMIGEGCRIGINVSLNPGIKIGHGSFVAGGMVVGSDIPDRSFVTMKDGAMHIKENRHAASAPESREEFRTKALDGKKKTK